MPSITSAANRGGAVDRSRPGRASVNVAGHGAKTRGGGAWTPAPLSAVPDFRSAQGAPNSASALMVDPLPALSHDELETLQAALDPLLDGFGASGSCLDDALAYLGRLGVLSDGVGAGGKPGCSALPLWIERWREAGGNRQTLRLMVATLLALAPAGASQGGPAAGLAGDGTSST